ncbi:uncharacterized protein LY89DRAFT_683707 [Mollisia scopiformis]|uniref:Uncharacterized protein n=1 Tax=Mollisia scopiformis TaxID=149040 RepID=A0A194XFE8_MOLSC|nr:uncharacterized protein LY89DRAFT_683707 [Mollisia scopiformis]KUJ18859.1 hypothetical protein LY89DRAFT_683707 [Mollisia scopiformis]
MRDLNRLQELARGANAYTKERLPTVEILRRDSIVTSPVDQVDAKEKLVFQRTSSVYYKDPNKQKRNILRSKEKKSALANTEGWSYNKAERYAVLDLEIRNGGPAGLAQAVLAFDMRDPLDVNVTYVADDNGHVTSTGKQNGWLELAAGRNARNDVAYIRLLSNFGASQASRNRALKIALDRKAMETAQELLRNGADPNSDGVPEHFLAAIRDQNQRLYTMFLTSIEPLNTFYINQALIKAVGQDSDLVALLIAHGADGMSNDGQALCVAVNIKSLEEAAMILTNPEGELSARALNLAANTACAIVDENMKVRLLDMLFSAGAEVNTSRIQDELLEAVRKDQISLVNLLINHGTSPDRNNAEGLRLAIISSQTELVQILLQGPVPEVSTSRALDEANGLEDPDAFEEIVRALVEKGVSRPSLAKCLADAVEKGCTALAPMLIERGATLEYSNARCVRTALKRNDFGLFGTLLKAPCQPSILCDALPDAMNVQPPSERFDIMIRLLNKGVSGKQLHISLQTVAASAKDPADYSLIEALMRYHASVDFVDKNGNCICTAAAQQDEKSLDLLCQGNPSPETVSDAIRVLHVSFAAAEAAEYEQQVGMMSTLLEKGAYGIPVAEMLIKAVRDDHREKALTALIRFGADANYQHGKAIEEALKLPRISALDSILKDGKIAKNTFAAQLPNALNSLDFDFDKASMLVHASQDYEYEELLDKPLLDEIETNGARKSVVELLLNLGASVNYQHGGALQHAVNAGNVEICCLLLSAGVQHANIALAFPATGRIVDRATRYSLMKALLEAGQFDIGQDQALVQAAHEAINCDLTHVELLLEHHASANFNDGAAIIESITTKNLPLLKRFVPTELNHKSLSRAFALARKIECLEDERYDMFETLLQVFAGQDQISSALIETVLHDVTDIKTSSLLLSHGASLEPDNARAMREVSFKGSLDLLRVFLATNPTQFARDAGFHSATRSHLAPEQRNPIYRNLLETGITQELVSQALLIATITEAIDHSLLNMLIGFNASLDFDAGTALHGVVNKGDLSTLDVLLTGDILQKQTLDRSFSEAMKLDGSNRLEIAKVLLEKDPGVNQATVSHHLGQIVQENDHDLLSLMMDYEPDPAYNRGESLILSARAGDSKSAELLARAEIPKETVNEAFEQLLNARAIRSNLTGGLKTAEILLTLGIEQHLVDRALLDSFDDKIDDLTSKLVELLIPYKPDVNGGDGKLFVDMATIGNEELFRRLASQKPNLNIVIPALIRSIENEDELIHFLGQLEECAERESVPLEDFVIFRALEQFPEGHLLVKHLLNNGCRANSKTEDILNSATGTETMTVLIWALSRLEPLVSEAVVVEILEDGHVGLQEEHNAEVSFETSLTRTSATILASAAGQNSTLERLIKLKFDLTHRDWEDHSPLFFASRNGHLETARILIEAGAAGNDGSLHEAAREAHPELITLLLANGHRDDYPSSVHADGDFGRTPLEELCQNATSGTENWPKRVHASIAQLFSAQVANIPKSGGKTMLHLALENRNSPIDVTRELLSFPSVWEKINDPVYLYTDEQGYVYSPTKYVELLFSLEDPEKCTALTKLLKARKCKDRFYAHTVDQPPGAVGLPEEVAEAVNKQKRADHEQREELKRREEVAARQRALDDVDHVRNQASLREKHQLTMRQLKEQEDTERQVAQDKQILAVRHAQELQRKRQEALAAENRIRVEGVAEEAAHRRANTDREQASEISHRRALDSMERSAQQAKYAAEQSLISIRDSASREEFRRQKELCDIKDASARYQAQQRAQHSQY